METEFRPNPEELLKAIKRDEYKKQHGRLKIFLGMAAGVGKTYAMLEAAQRLKKEGFNVVVGVVNTHGRHETAALLEGLIIVPEKQISYKGRNFGELNVEEIIRLKPDLALVDELAHSNTPGSTHPKRWQDVMDLLEEGIDVYSTLNIQHIESLKDIVEGITDVTIRETVPDLVIEKTDHIELIDLTPEELLQRLKEGKVYLGDQATRAAENFFQEDKLTALRELVLRFAAEKVDHDLHHMMLVKEHGANWKTRDRLLACISATADSEKLIRATRRLAFSLDAPWSILYIDKGSGLNNVENTILSKNLRMARDLGADVITTYGDPAEVINKIVKEKSITQIVLNRPHQNAFLGFHFAGFGEKLAKACPGVDLHFIPPDSDKNQNNAIALPSHRFPRYLMLFLAAIAIILWGWYEGTYYLILGFMALLIIGLLIERIYQQQQLLSSREVTTRALYDIFELIAKTPSTKDLIASICPRLGIALHGTCDMVIKDVDGNLDINDPHPLINNQKTYQTVLLVFSKENEAGWSTDTLPGDPNFYMPIKDSEVVGVLMYRPDNPDRLLSNEEKNFIYTISRQLAGYLNRNLQDEKARIEDQRLQTEKIHKMILKLISHEFQSPISSLQKAVEELKQSAGVTSSRVIPMFNKIGKYSDFLGRVVDNISAMAKLSSGLIPLNKQYYSISSLIHRCCEHIKEVMNGHQLQISIADDLPELLFDFSLMELLLYNLLSNALKFSPPDSIVEVTAHQEDSFVILSVADQGSGIPQEQLETIFEKFYRMPGPFSGVGLGLAIVKSVTEMHNGYLHVENRKEGGSKFSLFLPIS